MRYKKGTLYYIESTCRRLGTRYDIENDRFIPEDEDKVELISRNFNLFLRGLAKELGTALKKDMAERDLISKEPKTKYQTMKKPT